VLVGAGITKRFGAVTALAGVDIRVDPGEVVALVGENGSGKSTLSRILSGVLTPDEGMVELDGVACSFSSPAQALEHGIALVAQELTAVPEMSVAENVMLTRIPVTLGRVRRRQLCVQAQPFLDAVGVRCDPAARFSSLRSGDRELVEVAKALAARPRLMILDEATSRLGESDVERLFSIVRRLREEGTSTLLITHRLREIVEIADRAVVLRDGRSAGELSRREVSDERLSSMMVGRDLVDFFHKRTIPFGRPLLEVDDLEVEGGRGPISFEVRAGEVLGLAGLVGAGRTEVLETIAGIRPVVAGSIRIDGAEVRNHSPRGALRAGLALVPEDRRGQGLVLGRSIAENVALGSWRTAGVVDRRRERREGADSIDRLRIRAPHADVEVRTLSGGNQQKVVLARCLSTNPKVLLLDEPTRGIDVGAKEEIFRLMGDMLEAGMGIVMASSELMELLGICDRILVLHDRAMAGELDRTDATEERIALLSAGGQVNHGA
jgi:ribose transport system ATP-binding protein